MSKFLLKGSISELAQKNTAVIIQEMRAQSDTDHSESEINSWEKSLIPLIKKIDSFGFGALTFIAEYQTPLEGRIDGILIGKSLADDSLSLMVIENKQWSNIQNIDPEHTLFKVKGMEGLAVNPILQTNNYLNALKYHHDFFEKYRLKIKLYGVVNLHNASSEDCSKICKVSDIKKNNRVFAKEDVQAFQSFLNESFSKEPVDSTELDAFVSGEFTWTEAVRKGFEPTLQCCHDK